MSRCHTGVPYSLISCIYTDRRHRCTLDHGHDLPAEMRLLPYLAAYSHRLLLVCRGHACSQSHAGLNWVPNVECAGLPTAGFRNWPIRNRPIQLLIGPCPSSQNLASNMYSWGGWARVIVTVSVWIAQDVLHLCCYVSQSQDIFPNAIFRVLSVSFKKGS